MFGGWLLLLLFGRRTPAPPAPGRTVCLTGADRSLARAGGADASLVPLAGADRSLTTLPGLTLEC